ncbi:MAG: tRNA (guanosine(18)-2'-O)-methyltransferase TrmH [Gammaproteobacteria bacterium]|nr:MAG: tRNA (guanosine(18)-2'-O)-methyltransferase TrmH [Gammaproteobacteria bacterium]
MSPERYAKILHVLKHRQPDLTVVVDQVHKPHNISAIIRTCDAVGVGHVHAVWPEDDALFRVLRRQAKGAERWVEVHHHNRIQDVGADLKGRGFTLVAAHLSDRAVPYRDVDWTQPIALIMGQEREGMTEEAAELADVHAIIPMLGMVESYNVSVAAAIMLAEAQRQRQAKGMYDAPRLPREEYEALRFRWVHPLIARYCDEHGKPYPPLDEQGELLDRHSWRQ